MWGEAGRPEEIKSRSVLACKGLRSWLRVVGRNWRVIASSVPILGETCLKQRPSVSLSSPVRLLGSNLQEPGISSGDSCEKEKAEAWLQGGERVSWGREFTQLWLIRPPCRSDWSQDRDKQDDQSPQWRMAPNSDQDCLASHTIGPLNLNLVSGPKDELGVGGHWTSLLLFPM